MEWNRIEAAEMGKKREGRSKPELSRREVKSAVAASSNSSTTTTSVRSVIVVIIVVPIVISIILLKNHPTLNNNNNDDDDDNVYDHHHHQSLVRTDITYRQILQENMKKSNNLTTSRYFNNPVLAYITPWNSQGYDMAKKFTNKFTHLSPVWYQLKSHGTKLVLEGRHNVDKHWISQIRNNGDSKILPRVVLETNPVHLLNKKDTALNLILTECKDMGYDGIVLESWSTWAAYGVLHDPDMRNMAIDFVRQLGQAMHSASQSLELVYVIGPPRSDKQLEMYDFGSEDIERLNHAVDGFSLMTYDFSGPQNPGPNAPLQWIHSTLALLLRDSTSIVDRQKLGKKIFIGINFYGNDFVVSGGVGGGPIVGREFLSLLEKHQPQLHWEKNSAEHYLLYMDNQDVNHVVFYPSLKSIAMRLQEARSWGAGISIWEIGQGLEYFFDIL